MKINKLPDWNYVNERLDFNPDTGDITWKYVKPRSSVKIGDIAGYINSIGYRVICMDGKRYYAHRIMYYIFNPEFDQNLMIDHRDGDTSNNILSNLRECSNSKNQMNTKLNSSNSSGYKNITISTYIKNNIKYNYWRVCILGKTSKKRVRLEQKCFPYTDEGLQDAIEFRDIKLKQHFGEYSRVA